MSVFTEILKYIIYVCIILLTISGLTLLTFGSLLQFSVHYHLVISTILSVVDWTLFQGIFILFIIPLGCYANCKENRKYLLLFTILVGIVFVNQVGLGLYAAVAVDSDKEHVKYFIEQFEKALKDNNSHFLKKLGEVEEKLQCCGVNGPKDYLTTPNTCCNKEENCTNIYNKGCAEVSGDHLKWKTKVIAYVALVFSLPQPVQMLVSITLIRKYKRRSETSDTESDSV